ncbi:hypothetical protein D3C86_1295510 [compost metagenome]
MHGQRRGFHAGRGVHRLRLQAGQRVARVAFLQRLQRAEDLGDGDTARRRRRHAAHLPALVVRADRHALLGAITLEIGRAQAARIGMAVDLGSDVPRDWPVIEHVRTTLGDLAQGLGQLRILDEGADRLGLALRIEEVAGHLRRADHELVRRHLRVEPLRHREAILGQRDGPLEQPRPGQPAMLAVRHLQRAQHAGHAHRAAADLAFGELHRLAVRAHEQVLGGAGRGRLAAIVGLHALAVPVHDEGAATDAGGLRLHQRQHGLHGDSGVDGRAPRAQDLAPGLGGQRIGRGSHVLLPVAGGHARPIARGDLRRRRHGRRRRLRRRGRGRVRCRWRAGVLGGSAAARQHGGERHGQRAAPQQGGG